MRLVEFFVSQVSKARPGPPRFMVGDTWATHPLQSALEEVKLLRTEIEKEIQNTGIV